MAACGFAGLTQCLERVRADRRPCSPGHRAGDPQSSVSGCSRESRRMSEQGAVFGTLTSAQTLARMISYSAANFLLGRVSTAAPYWGACGIDLLRWHRRQRFGRLCAPAAVLKLSIKGLRAASPHQ